MKLKQIVVIILALIAVVVVIGLLRSNGDLSSENAELRDREIELQNDLQHQDQISKEAIAEYEKKIAELNGNIDSSNTIIAGIGEKDEALADRTKRLEAARREITNKDALISNLEQQVETWRARFSLAQDTIAEKDKIIFSLTDKYEIQLKITKEREAQILARDNLLEIKDLRIAGLEKQIARDHFWSKAKSYALVGTLGYVLIDIIAGMARS